MFFSLGRAKFNDVSVSVIVDLVSSSRSETKLANPDSGVRISDSRLIDNNKDVTGVTS